MSQQSHSRLARGLVVTLLTTLAALFFATACESDRTGPSYGASNPPPAPQHTPRALQHGGHMGARMSDELSEEEAEKLKGEAGTDPAPPAVPGEGKPEEE